MKLEDIVNKKNHIGTCCVYFLIKNNEVVYIGQSKNGGFDRIGAHLNYGDKQFDSYYIKNCYEKNMDILEAKYILQFNPKLNKCLPSNSKYKSIPFILIKYKIWNKQWLFDFIKFNKIRVYLDKYVDFNNFKKVWKMAER